MPFVVHPLRAKDKRLCLTDLHPPEDTFLADVLAGMMSVPRQIPCKYFYDRKGSELFEQITQLPEYYPTRTELSIMENYTSEIVQLFDEEVLLVELGSGSSMKTRILLEAMQGMGITTTYMPVDISRDFLFETATQLSVQFPDMSVEAVAADFLQGIEYLGSSRRDMQTVLYFPGSTIGNFTSEEAIQFLRHINQQLHPGDGFVLGTDLKKDPAIIHAAYNDSEGVTARFNCNLLARINHELGGDFPLEDYRHIALYNEQESRIEMYLESVSSHTVHLDSQAFFVREGERILTEYSHKYDSARVAALAVQAGFALGETWKDDKQLFGVHWLYVRD